MANQLTPDQLEQRRKMNGKIFKVLGGLIAFFIVVGVGSAVVGGGDEETKAQPTASSAPALKSSSTTSPEPSATQAPAATPEPSATAESSAPSDATASTTTSSESGIDAEGMAATFKESLGGQPINSLCDPGVTNWSCFYDGVEPGSSYLRVKLTTDNGASDPDAMADTAGRAWFNFLACK